MNDPLHETQIAFLQDDEAVKTLLMQAGIHLSPPAPPNDLVISKFVVGGFFWLACRFYCPGDEGHVALGIPENASLECKKAFVAFVIGHLKDMGKSNGIDVFAHSYYKQLEEGVN